MDPKFLFEHACNYALLEQNCNPDDACDYAMWYAQKFPTGTVGHNDKRAFYAWTIRRSR